MPRITVLKGINQTMSTGSGMIAVSTAAAAAAGAHIKIKRLEIGAQVGVTTLAICQGEFSTRDNAGTYTTTSLTPTAIQPVGGPASGLSGNTSVIGGTARSGITSTADSGGTYTTIYPFSWANTAGYLYKPAPDEELWFPASTIFVVRFSSAPGTLTGWTFTLVMAEE